MTRLTLRLTGLMVLGLGTLLGSAFQSSASAVTVPELIAHFGFDNTFDDSSANGFDAQPGAFDAPTFNASDKQFGAASADFEADDIQHLFVSHSSAFENLENLTIATWIKPESWDGARRLFQKGTDDELSLRRVGGSGVFTFNNNGERMEAGQATSLLPEGQWYHVTAVVDGANDVMKLYKDGTQIASGDLRGKDVTNITADFYIAHKKGHNSRGDNFDGLMDEFFIFADALTETQIKNLMDFNSPAQVSAVLSWDGGGNGNWGDSRWVGDTPPPFPDDTILAVVKTNTVTVAADRAAHVLVVESGGVVIGSAGQLTVAEDVDLRSDASLNVAGVLNAGSLTSAGTTTFQSGSRGTIGALNVTGGTTTMATPDVTTLNVTAGTLNAAAIDVSELKISGSGTAQVSGPVNAEVATVSGGSLTVAGGNLGTLHVDGGSLATTADLTVENMEVTAGAVNTQGNRVIVGNRLETLGLTIAADAGNFRVKGVDPVADLVGL